MNYRFLCVLLFLPGALCISAYASDDTFSPFGLSNQSTIKNGSSTVFERINSSQLPAESGIVRVSTIEMVIEPNGLVAVTETVIVRLGDVVSILLPSGIEDLEIFDSKGENLVYDAVPAGTNQLVSFIASPYPGKKEDQAVIKYVSQHFTGKADEVWTFNYSTLTTPMVTRIKISAPKNTQIVKIDFKDFNWAPIGPSEIEFYPLVKNFTLSFSYRMNVGGGSIIPRRNSTSTTLIPVSSTTRPVNQDNRSMTVVVAVLIALAAILVYVVKTRQMKQKTGLEANKSLNALPDKNELKVGSMEIKWDQPVEVGSSEMAESKFKKPKKPVVKESIVNILDDNEKKIIKILEQAGDEITQAYIYKSTGIPKSSLSETIKRLEKRNIIEIKREGRINWLKLKEWVFE